MRRRTTAQRRGVPAGQWTSDRVSITPGADGRWSGYSPNGDVGPRFRAWGPRHDPGWGSRWTSRGQRLVIKAHGGWYQQGLFASYSTEPRGHRLQNEQLCTTSAAGVAGIPGEGGAATRWPERPPADGGGRAADGRARCGLPPAVRDSWWGGGKAGAWWKADGDVKSRNATDGVVDRTANHYTEWPQRERFDAASIQ